MRRAFSFDASACTGCKACQVACKDKHSLPDGVLWRRVYEVTGGTWERRGAAWANNIFAYNASIGCNHCADPVCAAACPTDAYTVRDDGIVWLDAAKCVGCGYCGWVCPYGAPQYSATLGRTTKCDLCRDLIDGGLPPACVAACPMRALDLIDRPAATAAQRIATAVFPLPPASRTQPALAITPHPAMLNDLPKAVGNREEIKPAHKADDRELPLVAFTLLAQAAAGTALIGGITGAPVRATVAAVATLTALAALVSLFHLGTKTNAWRATANLRRSALSREVLMLGLLGVLWVVALFAPAAGRVALAVAGVGLVYSMVDVYRVEAVPGWTSWRTGAAFAASALLLGAIVVLALDPVMLFIRSWVGAAAAVAVVWWQVTMRRRFYARLRDRAM